MSNSIHILGLDILFILYILFARVHTPPFHSRIHFWCFTRRSSFSIQNFYSSSSLCLSILPSPQGRKTMKLTPELIIRSESSLNTLNDRQLDLRGLKIPAIENLGVTRDQNDSIDLTDNDIRTLTNFPNLIRLHTLILSNNLINRIDRKIANSLPNLQSLILTNNALSDLSSLVPLGRFAKLEFISLMGNPVTRKQHYREFVVWQCRSLRVLDFQRVKQVERERAKQLMETKDGRPSALATSLSDQIGVIKSAEDTSVGKVGTFEVGTTNGNGNGASAGRRMTAEERKALEEAIENSTSLEEIKRLEDRLRLGYTI